MSNRDKRHISFNDAIWSKYPNLLDLTKPLSILAVAQARHFIKLSMHHTFYLLDVSQLNCVENAIIFDGQQGILKTTQTTRELIREYWVQADLWHRPSLKYWAQKLGITQHKIPFIKGDVCLIPLGANTQKSTSWFSTASLTGHVKRTGKQTELVYDQRLRLIIPVSTKVIKRQLTDSQQMQVVLNQTMARQLQFITGELPPSESSPSLWQCDRTLAYNLIHFAFQSRDLVFTSQDVQQTLNTYLGKF